ncbi:hypothetical protein GAMM_60001 [Gammaproteobacteria bacterium]
MSVVKDIGDFCKNFLWETTFYPLFSGIFMGAYIELAATYPETFTGLKKEIDEARDKTLKVQPNLDLEQPNHGLWQSIKEGGWNVLQGGKCLKLILWQCYDQARNDFEKYDRIYVDELRDKDDLCVKDILDELKILESLKGVNPDKVPQDKVPKEDLQKLLTLLKMIDPKDYPDPHIKDEDLARTLQKLPTLQSLLRGKDSTDYPIIDKVTLKDRLEALQRLPSLKGMDPKKYSEIGDDTFKKVQLEYREQRVERGFIKNAPAAKKFLEARRIVLAAISKLDKGIDYILSLVGLRNAIRRMQAHFNTASEKSERIEIVKVSVLFLRSSLLFSQLLISKGIFTAAKYSTMISAGAIKKLSHFFSSKYQTNPAANSTTNNLSKASAELTQLQKNSNKGNT